MEGQAFLILDIAVGCAAAGLTMSLRYQHINLVGRSGIRGEFVISAGVNRNEHLG